MKLLDQLIAERAEIAASVEATLNRAADEHRDLSEHEDKNIGDLTARAKELDGRIADLREIQIANLEAAKLRAEVASTDSPKEAPAVNRIEVKSEPLTYRADVKEHNFFRDGYAAQFLGDAAAAQRLARHQDEMRVEHRDSGSSNFAGLVVPQYLTGLAAPYLRAGRNTCDVARQLPLTDSGLTVNVSRVTTGSSVTAQNGDNGAVTEASPDDTLLTVNVRTYAGMVDVSRQALERGTGVEGLLAADLVSAYNSAVNADVINGDGTAGTHLGILQTSGIGDIDVDDASPTGYETFQKIVKAIGTVTAARYKQPDVIIMHPRRWAYIAGSLDSSNRPLAGVSVATSTNIVALGNPGAYGVAAGELAGIPVVVDAGIPTNLGAGTNEDAVIVACREDLILWEAAGQPLMVRYDQVGSGTLTVRMVVFGYSAFTAGRYPGGIAKCQGTLFAATL
jgi:HK97 family phage major capsid protein